MWSDPIVLACTVCFGAADGTLLTSARLGVAVMAAFTCAILAAFAVFFRRIARLSTYKKRGQSPFFAKKGDSRRYLQNLRKTETAE